MEYSQVVVFLLRFLRVQCDLGRRLAGQLQTDIRGTICEDLIFRNESWLFEICSDAISSKGEVRIANYSDDRNGDEG